MYLELLELLLELLVELMLLLLLLLLDVFIQTLRVLRHPRLDA